MWLFSDLFTPQTKSVISLRAKTKNLPAKTASKFSKSTFSQSTRHPSVATEDEFNYGRT